MIEVFKSTETIIDRVNELAVYLEDNWDISKKEAIRTALEIDKIEVLTEIQLSIKGLIKNQGEKENEFKL